MAGKRKLKRRPLITYLQVTRAADNRLLGRADEITVEGLHVQACEPLEAGSLHTLRVALPIELAGLLYFDVQVRCVSCPRSSNPDLHDAHLQFLDLSPDAMEAIEELIRRFAQ